MNAFKLYEWSEIKLQNLIHMKKLCTIKLTNGNIFKMLKEEWLYLYLSLQ